MTAFLHFYFEKHCSHYVAHFYQMVPEMWPSLGQGTVSHWGQPTPHTSLQQFPTTSPLCLPLPLPPAKNGGHVVLSYRHRTGCSWVWRAREKADSQKQPRLCLPCGLGPPCLDHCPQGLELWEAARGRRQARVRGPAPWPALLLPIPCAHRHEAKRLLFSGIVKEGCTRTASLLVEMKPPHAIWG